MQWKQGPITPAIVDLSLQGRNPLRCSPLNVVVQEDNTGYHSITDEKPVASLLIPRPTFASKASVVGPGIPRWTGWSIQVVLPKTGNCW